MKKLFIFAASVVILASCANDEIINNGDKLERNVPISFLISQKNMTRATLQSQGHYNFGVWSYKDTDHENAIMKNYLVGYMDADAKKGYYMTAANQSTLDDTPSTSEDGKSMWAYEKMGTDETQYNYTGTDGYYKTSDTKYMSNNTHQWLKYWDLSSASTEFFAYAPYIHTTTGENAITTPEFNITSKKMTFADNSIIAGFDDLSLYEYMYAYTKIAKADYKKDVPLAFKRMNSKINIKFWEDIDGYDVEIVDLKGNTGKLVTGVQATPAIYDASATPKYKTSDKFYVVGGAVVDFSGTEPSCVVTGKTNSTDNLEFAIPTFATGVDPFIGTTRANATPSPSIYYGLPLGSSNITGFTFHISYKLIAKDTKEVIYVNNATVHVPASFVKWEANNSYTYIFKITKASSGTTDKTDPKDNDYVSPTPNDEDALYPIVFDNCTVEDWSEADSQHIVNGTANGED